MMRKHSSCMSILSVRVWTLLLLLLLLSVVVALDSVIFSDDSFRFRFAVATPINNNNHNNNVDKSAADTVGQSESWDISILVPSRGIVPPHHRLTVTSSSPSGEYGAGDASDADSISVRVTPISYSAIQRLVFRLGTFLTLTQPFQFDSFLGTGEANKPTNSSSSSATRTQEMETAKIEEEEDVSMRPPLTGLCPIPPAWATMSFTGVWKTRAVEGVPDGIYAVGCEPQLFLPVALTMLQHRQVNQYPSSPVPLHVTAAALEPASFHRGGTREETAGAMQGRDVCVPLSWKSTGVRSIRLAEDRWVVVLDFEIPSGAGTGSNDASSAHHSSSTSSGIQDENKDGEERGSDARVFSSSSRRRCYIPLEGIRHEDSEVSDARHSRLSSYIAPLLLMVLLSGLRSKFVKRKVEKTLGGRSATTPATTSTGTSSLSNERREELLRQQDELIRQMKEQDRREGRLQ